MKTRLYVAVLMVALISGFSDSLHAEVAPEGAQGVRDNVAQCREQLPQGFLIRANMKKDKAGFAAAMAKEIKYRVTEYGFVPGLSPKYGQTSSAPSQTIAAQFMGQSVTLHKKILPALACVEEEIEQKCGAFPYQPAHLSGLRTRNTYRGGEISNHMFGLAIDIDPDRNPCCGCVKPWSESWKCKHGSSPFDRVEFPRCWVTSFEKFGFYWLGWDEMQDTMHFEFLGDPEAIAL